MTLLPRPPHILTSTHTQITQNLKVMSAFTDLIQEKRYMYYKKRLIAS